MCGIVGTVNVAESRAEARVAMLNEWQQHRAPYNGVIARADSFTLGNTRLAIQDPSPAVNQPFRSLDGRLHRVFNGEIYNYRALIKKYDLPMRTSCDGEVIPHLWAKIGSASLAELRDMFVVVIVHSLEKRLHLARDPLGIKPLYWRLQTVGSLVFGSEGRPSARIEAGVQISREAIARYLHLGAMAADQSQFSETMGVPPNGVACFSIDGRMIIRSIAPAGPLAANNAPKNLALSLEESIALHPNADVPTAFQLSAGVDSATIVAIGHRLGRTLHCLTIASEDVADECDDAAETARHYGHRFQRIPVAPEACEVVNFFGAMQRPTIDGINTYLVCRAVHDAGFKVALSGLGGDEVVGGYSYFRLPKYLPTLRALQRMPERIASAGAWPESIWPILDSA